ncbi:MAG: Ig domain-containing protein [Verrucomicrobiota bacterium]
MPYTPTAMDATVLMNHGAWNQHHDYSNYFALDVTGLEKRAVATGERKWDRGQGAFAIDVLVGMTVPLTVRRANEAAPGPITTEWYNPNSMNASLALNGTAVGVPNGGHMAPALFNTTAPVSVPLKIEGHWQSGMYTFAGSATGEPPEGSDGSLDSGSTWDYAPANSIFIKVVDGLPSSLTITPKNGKTIVGLGHLFELSVSAPTLAGFVEEWTRWYRPTATGWREVVGYEVDGSNGSPFEGATISIPEATYLHAGPWKAVRRGTLLGASVELSSTEIMMTVAELPVEAEFDMGAAGIGCQQFVEFYYAPASSTLGGGLSWAAVGLPRGLSISSATGVIRGIPEAVGVFNSVITASNSNNTARAIFTIAVDEAGFVGGSGVKLAVDVVDRTVENSDTPEAKEQKETPATPAAATDPASVALAATTAALAVTTAALASTVSGKSVDSPAKESAAAAPSEPPLFSCKENDDLVVNVQFQKSGVATNLSLAALTLVLKENEPDEVLLESTDWRAIDAASGLYALRVRVSSAALAATLADHEADDGTEFLALAEISWAENSPWSVGPRACRSATKTFRVRVARDLGQL